MNKLTSILLAAATATSSIALFSTPNSAKDEGKQINSASQPGSSKQMKVGMKAPDFTLPSQSGAMVSLHDFLGKSPIVLYFYPKDETPICTKEACAFRDSMEQFRDLKATVIGVSADSVESHKEFAQKHNLPFILVSDKDNELRKSYGVQKTMGMMPGRVTYVIGKDGLIKVVFASQLDAEKHVKEALATLKEETTRQ